MKILREYFKNNVNKKTVISFVIGCVFTAVLLVLYFYFFNRRPNMIGPLSGWIGALASILSSATALWIATHPRMEVPNIEEYVSESVIIGDNNYGSSDFSIQRLFSFVNTGDKADVLFKIDGIIENINDFPIVIIEPGKVTNVKIVEKYKSLSFYVSNDLKFNSDTETTITDSNSETFNLIKRKINSYGGLKKHELIKKINNIETDYHNYKYNYKLTNIH